MKTTLMKKFTGFGFRKPLNAVRDAIKSIYANGFRSVPVNTKTTTKFNTFCCALALYSASDFSTVEELQYQIDRLREESKLLWNTSTRASGEKCMMINVCPGEDILRQNLITLGFKHAHSFERRNGYPKTGLIEMWVYNV